MGFQYIRYLDGDQEILLATEVLPKKGPWVQLKKLVWEHVPEDHEQTYYPPAIGLKTWEAERDSDKVEPPLWPFSKQVELNNKLKVISHPEIIRYLFDQLKGIFSFFYWDFKDKDKNYSMALVEAPGWFEQKYLNRALEKVPKNGYRSTER